MQFVFHSIFIWRNHLFLIPNVRKNIKEISFKKLVYIISIVQRIESEN